MSEIIINKPNDGIILLPKEEVLENFKKFLVKINCNSDYLRIFELSSKFYLEYKETDFNNIKILDEFLKWLARYKYSWTTYNKHLYVLKIFFLYLYNRNYVSKEVLDYCNSIKKIDNKGIKINSFITLKELNYIIKRGNLWFRIKNIYEIKTLLYFIYFTGITKKELIILKREHFNLNNNSVEIGVGSSKERRGYYPKEVKELLIKYFNSEKEKINAFNFNEYKAYFLNNILKRYKLRKKHFSLKILRDSFANNIVKRTKNLDIARKLLGLNKNSDMSKYDSISDNDIELIYKKKVKIIDKNKSIKED